MNFPLFVWFSLFKSGYRYVGQSGLELTTLLSLSVPPPSNPGMCAPMPHSFNGSLNTQSSLGPGGKVVSLLLGMIQNTLLLEPNLF